MEDLVLSCLESRVEENRNLYARFLVGPFLKGDALTVATALRRVLLSSIESIGITAIYIQGITHEFSTIVGVRESVLELSLNFQAIVLSYDKTFFQKKSFFDDLQIGYLQVQGPKVIYANHLKLPLGVKLVDPTQYIATVSKEGSIVLKFIIGKKKSFLHQNTGPEFYFGNPARDLPITGKLSKKNIGRAKKTCFYKKGSTIDWLTMRFSSQNVLQRQAVALAPRLSTKQIKPLTKTYFSYKYPICMQSRPHTNRGFVRGSNLRFVTRPLTNQRFVWGSNLLTNIRFVLVRGTSFFAKRSFALINKRVALAKIEPSLLSSSFPSFFSQKFYRISSLEAKKKKLVSLSPSAKPKVILSVNGTRSKTKKERPFEKQSVKSGYYQSFALKKSKANQIQKANREFIKGEKKLFCSAKLEATFRFLQSQQKQIKYLKRQDLDTKREKSKFCSHKTKSQFVMHPFSKQRRRFTNARFLYKYPIWACTSSLLKKDLALVVKKDENREKNDKKKKILFFKSNDNVFKSNICLRNVIPLDLTLTPVLKVNFVVEIDDEVLYLRQKVRERVILEVWTNGSIHPRQAVHDAALFLTDIFASFRSIYEAKS